MGWYEGLIYGIVLIKTHTLRNTNWTHSSFLVVSRPDVRGKVGGSRKGIHLYILSNTQYVEAENNCPAVFNKEELRPCPMKSRT